MKADKRCIGSDRITICWLLFINMFLCVGCVFAQGTQRQYLSGIGPDSEVLWDFYCSAGRRSGQWDKIPVPSQWELQGFGSYNYGHDRDRSDEQGRYRMNFSVPVEWNGKRIRLVFEGVMTDTLVKVNGIQAGEVHQGGFYEFSYDITDLVKFDDDNQLEVLVSKVSSNSSVESAERKADYWVFGGIYRPVYLEAVPAESIVRTAIDAKADGRFRMDVYLDGISTCDQLSAQILNGQDKPVGEVFACSIKEAQGQSTMQVDVSNPELWTAETPNLYKVRVDLKCKQQVVHTVTEKFGFRSFEVREKGLYLNGQRVMLKGVNRHSFRPDSGRCLGARDDIDDVKLIKSMNMNAVRCSHYPPNRTFLQACDELGLYVLDELAGWQKPPYKTEIGKKLVKEMVVRDVNHACILFWDNGNEGGWNTDLDGEFALYDPQNRPVLHPWGKFSGLDTDHYESYGSTLNKLKGPMPFMPTEFLHGLYDGGHGAGLADYWNAMKKSPYGAGGFLWVLADEGVVRTDLNGRIDTDGNHAPDGIVGPYHQKEASFYTIRDIWSPVQVNLDQSDFDGTVLVENCYDFTNLNRISFTWQLVNFVAIDSSESGHVVYRKGTQKGPDIAPGQQGMLQLSMPNDWRKQDCLYLTATDWNGLDLWTWSVPLKSRSELAADGSKAAIGQFDVVTADGVVTVTAGKYEYTFGASDGLLRQVSVGGRVLDISNGPRRVPVEELNQEPVVSCSETDVVYTIAAKGSGGLDAFCWKIYPVGELTLEYEYTIEGDYDNFGVSFDMPESSFKSMRWLGQGPCRVWKNRLHGGCLDVWQRDYNQGVPGSVWDYPVFGGFYADVIWLDLDTQSGSVYVYPEADDLYCRVGALWNGPDPQNTRVVPIEGDLSFLHAISPIGTKFMRASNLGPSGQKTTANGKYKGRLRFQFE